jgi:hypothetical protein
MGSVPAGIRGPADWEENEMRYSVDRFRIAFALIPLFAQLVLTVPAYAGAAAPSLRLDQAVYDLRSGVLHIAFTFDNPGDSAVYLDCQIPPRASLAGGTLTLIFARNATDAEGVRVGGRPPTDSAPAPAFDPDAYQPQRIAGAQTFQGQRRLDRVLGDASARPKFSRLKVAMEFYPERTEGEGPLYAAERGLRVAAPAHAVARKGKPPAPPKPVRIFRTER